MKKIQFGPLGESFTDTELQAAEAFSLEYLKFLQGTDLFDALGIILAMSFCKLEINEQADFHKLVALLFSEDNLDRHFIIGFNTYGSMTRKKVLQILSILDNGENCYGDDVSYEDNACVISMLLAVQVSESFNSLKRKYCEIFQDNASIGLTEIKALIYLMANKRNELLGLLKDNMIRVGFGKDLSEKIINEIRKEILPKEV